LRGGAGEAGARGEKGDKGEPGAPGLLPIVKAYERGKVHYRADVVVHEGSMWQAVRDTGHAPPHDD
jgi:hypothetical protein